MSKEMQLADEVILRSKSPLFDILARANDVFFDRRINRSTSIIDSESNAASWASFGQVGTRFNKIIELPLLHGKKYNKIKGFPVIEMCVSQNR
jgi:hypothetical protein